MANDEFDRNWIIENSIEVCGNYEPGVLTLRGLHYQLVALGMTNSILHYKRVVSAMIKCRRSGMVSYGQFSDHDREAIGETRFEETSLEGSIEKGEQQIEAWMTSYSKNRWENQDSYVELWIEKKALQGVFLSVAEDHEVALCPCKGYPSLTFLHEASERFIASQSQGFSPVIIYFGDHDPSGEDIPRSISDSFSNDFGVDVDVQVIGLTEEQCIELSLPPAPTKPGDTRSGSFSGLGQIELDAVHPDLLQQWASEAISKNFSQDLYQQLIDEEAAERIEYQKALKKYVEGI